MSSLVIALLALIGVQSIIGTIASYLFMKTWGWGDAAWGLKEYHRGTPDDTWHKRRRRAFYFLVIATLLLNPAGLAYIAIFGRRIFRRGVREASQDVYDRWYGKPAPPAK